MPNLKEKIQNELTTALKEKNKVASLTLRSLLAVILNKEKEKRYKISKKEPNLKEKELVEKSVLTEEEIIEVVSSEVKKRKEAILEFEKGERKDLADKEKAEAEILQKYLPEQLSEDELKKIIVRAIAKVGAKEIKDTGKIMAEVMPKIKGKADGTSVSKAVKELLSSQSE